MLNSDSVTDAAIQFGERPPEVVFQFKLACPGIEILSGRFQDEEVRRAAPGVVAIRESDSFVQPGQDLRLNGEQVVE